MVSHLDLMLLCLFSSFFPPSNLEDITLNPAASSRGRRRLMSDVADESVRCPLTRGGLRASPKADIQKHKSGRILKVQQVEDQASRNSSGSSGNSGGSGGGFGTSLASSPDRVITQNHMMDQSPVALLFPLRLPLEKELLHNDTLSFIAAAQLFLQICLNLSKSL